MQQNTQTDYLVAACLLAIAGAAFDVKTRKIPNRLTASGLLLGVAVHSMSEGLHGLLDSLGALVLAGAIFLFFYLLGGMGAGDVKLAAAVSAIAGSAYVPYLLILTALSGGVMALALIALRGRVRESMSNVLTLTSHHLSHGLSPHPELNVRNASTLRLPYGVAIAAGCTLTFLLHEVKQ